MRKDDIFRLFYSQFYKSGLSFHLFCYTVWQDEDNDKSFVLQMIHHLRLRSNVNIYI